MGKADRTLIRGVREALDLLRVPHDSPAQDRRTIAAVELLLSSALALYEHTGPDGRLS